MVEESAPDEMAVAKLAFKEGEKLRRQGLYSAADLKYDEAISCQIDFLGQEKASTTLEVATVVFSKAQNALIQCKYKQARQLYMQSFAIHCKINTTESNSRAFDRGDITIEQMMSDSTNNEGCAKAYFGMAEIYREQGEYESSLTLHQKVHALRT